MCSDLYIKIIPLLYYQRSPIGSEQDLRDKSLDRSFLFDFQNRYQPMYDMYSQYNA